MSEASPSSFLFGAHRSPFSTSPCSAAAARLSAPAPGPRQLLKSELTASATAAACRAWAPRPGCSRLVAGARLHPGRGRCTIGALELLREMDGDGAASGRRTKAQIAKPASGKTAIRVQLHQLQLLVAEQS